jgi:predicted CXXCH cytochrome family protein
MMSLRNVWVSFRPSRLAFRYPAGCAAGIASCLAAAWVLVGSLPGQANEVRVAFAAEAPKAPLAAHSEQADCVSCHRFKPILSHPVGVRPAMPMPSGFPLRDGRITCTTCHEVGSAEGAAAGQGQRPQLRGGKEGAAFCSECHQGSMTNRLAAHGQGIPFAHLPASGDQQGETAFGLDLESRSCMECHDGINGRDAGRHASRSGRFEAGQDHPVGVKYRSRPKSAHAEEIRLVNARALDPRVRLFDSAVGCGSCHSVYSSMENLLVMSNHGSQLCLKCHEQ